MKLNDGRFFPDSLVRLPIWILWKLESDQKGRVTKVLYSGNYNGRASSTNPNTWTTFDRVVKKLEQTGEEFNGIGICVSEANRLLFIDVDHCINEEGIVNEVGTDIINHMRDQFIEVSQSGSGLHILALGEIPKSFKNSKNGVEMYNKGRFIAMTGRAIREGEPHEDEEAISYVFETYRTPEKERKVVQHTVSDLDRDDQWIIDHASRRGRFHDLFRGEWTSLGYESQSEADVALCIILAFWCDCRPDQMDRIFRASSLYREKWDRGDYRDRTIETAIAHCDQTFSEYIRKGGDEFERAFMERW